MANFLFPTKMRILFLFFSTLLLGPREVQGWDEIPFKKTKYQLLNGELQSAKKYLLSLFLSRSDEIGFVHRYLAIIFFIEKDFKKSHEYLSVKEFDSPLAFGKICILKTLNEMALNLSYEMENTWNRCKVQNAKHMNENNLVWMEVMIELKLNILKDRVPSKNNFWQALGKIQFSREDLKILLKLLLYIDQEEVILNYVPSLTVDDLKDTELRELIGMTFFKLGQLKNAYSFIEDLKTPNAENIRGNLQLLRKNYKEAREHFKLALDQKPNSLNAIERLLPLAWITENTDEAFQYAQALPVTREFLIHKLTLLSAFSLKSEDYVKSDKYLQRIKGTSQKEFELEITQLASFNALMLKDPYQAKRYSRHSCHQSDFINCWLNLQLSLWKDFTKTSARKDEIPHLGLWEKLTKEEINHPLQEKIYINQMDVEELDDQLIKLSAPR